MNYGYGYAPYRPYTHAQASYPRPDADYMHALAEEEAARRQYADALRAQEDARRRAARARLARQAYESAHSSYLSDEDDEYSTYAVPVPREPWGAGITYPRRSRPAFDAALKERERERRIQELEEELRRKREEEERQRRFQLEQEERERRLREQEFLRRQQQQQQQARQQATPLSPLEEFFGLRPQRMQQSQDTPLSRRARTVSPGFRARNTSEQEQQQPSRSPPAQTRTSTNTSIPINVPTTPSASIPIHTTSPKPTSPKAAPSPKPQAQQTPTPTRAPTEEEIAAAQTFQTYWRRRAAFRAIAAQAARFDALRRDFVLPAALEYTQPSEGGEKAVVSVPVPDSVRSRKHLSEEPTATSFASDSETESETEDEPESPTPALAYTRTNAPVHAYNEELARVLGALDGVESGGDARVRRARREVVRRVEREARWVERVRGVVWRTKEAQQQKGTEEVMEVEEARAEETHAEAVVPTEVVHEQEPQPQHPHESDEEMKDAADLETLSTTPSAIDNEVHPAPASSPSLQSNTGTEATPVDPPSPLETPELVPDVHVEEPSEVEVEVETPDSEVFVAPLPDAHSHKEETQTEKMGEDGEWGLV
ncbi:hypothetical protein BDW22DRAFT_1362040 [Trametopsis cervina]|nr:hypothetical protein BDW22DRAFT_1362040 [Trametopsis cervina]